MTDKIIFLHKKGLTNIEISGVLDISRQRVHQKLAGYKTLNNSKLKKKLMDLPCTDCNGKTVNIHHNDKNSMNNIADNLVPLCKKCHLLRHYPILKSKDLDTYVAGINTSYEYVDDEIIKELLIKGHSVKDIRKKLQVGAGRIARIRREYSIPYLFNT